MSRDLLVLEIDSIVTGFKVLNDLPTEGKIRVLDAEPVGGGRFLILVTGQAAELSEIAKTQRDSLVDHELISNVDDDVLEATYSLGSATLQESLVVAETETASAMFSLAQTLVAQHGLAPIEIRLRKSGASGAYAYFTGPRNVCGPAAEDVRTRLRNTMRTGTVEILDQPNEAVRQLFTGA